MDERSRRIGNKIREFRKREGISQEMLASRAGVSRQQMGRLESGNRTLKPDMLERIAHALRVPVSRLEMDVVERIAETLRLLGYRTFLRPATDRGEDNTCRVDIEATLHTGPISMKLAVIYRPSIASGHIEEMATLVRRSQFDKGIFVLERVPDDETADLAGATGVELVHIEDLESQLVDLRPYAQSLIERFRAEVPHYVDPACRTESDASMPLRQFVDGWIEQGLTPHVLLLGEPGGGKSTACKAIASVLAERYIRAPKVNPAPIQVSLWEFPYIHDILQLLFRELLQGYGLQVSSVDALHRMLSAGRFVLILDGVDEVTPRWSPDDIRRELRAITRVMKSGSPVLLTSRTQVFEGILESSELQYVPGQWDPLTDPAIQRPPHVIRLEKFDWLRIEAFIKRHDQRHWSEIRDEICRANLESLASLPLALNLIVGSLSRNRPVSSGSETLASVLGGAAESWAHQEALRLGRSGRRLLNELEEKADYYWKRNRYTPRDGSRASGAGPERRPIDGEHGAGGDEEREGSAYDSVFGVRLEHGEYLFQHQVFLKYFLARKTCREIESGDDAMFCSRWYDSYVATLVAQMWTDRSKLAESLAGWLLKNTNPAVREKAAFILGHGQRGDGGSALEYASENDLEIGVRNAAVYARARQGDLDVIEALAGEARESTYDLDRLYARLELILLSDDTPDQIDPIVTTAVAETLKGASGGWIEKELDRYCQLLKDPLVNETLKLPMAKALGIRGTEQHCGCLEELLERSNSEGSNYRLSPSLSNVCGESLERLQKKYVPNPPVLLPEHTG